MRDAHDSASRSTTDTAMKILTSIRLGLLIAIPSLFISCGDDTPGRAGATVAPMAAASYTLVRADADSDG